MSKQTIGLGAAVDDSTGDYMRQGGTKINANFDETYSELGDGSAFHPAGAWKTHAFTNGASLTPALGKQYNVNTLAGPVSITLPKGSVADYGRVIKIRDVHASWGTNAVSIRPTSGDSLGGSTNPVSFSTDFTTLEFVYSSPATWRYVANMKLDSMPKTSGAGVVSKTFKVTATQYNTGFFTDISATGYNAAAVQVYRNGALLSYDPTSNFSNSDYGSRNGSVMTTLNGIDIFVPYVVDGDIITIVTFTKDVTSAPVSYIRYDLMMLDPSVGSAVAGQSALIKTNGVYTLTNFGRPTDEEYNPGAFQLYLNGTLLVEAGKATLSPTGSEDYALTTDAEGHWNTITISPVIQSGSILTICYFNNELGSIIEWDGIDGIKARTAQSFLNTEFRFNRLNKIRYTDTALPSATTAAVVPGTETNIRFENVIQLLESIYPVGSIYINANNAANPSTYMGFGTWTRYAKGRAIFGFDDSVDAQGKPDPVFGVNTSVLDQDGNAMKIAGNLVGARQFELKVANIPELSSSIPYLRESVTGTGELNLSGCVPLPGSGTAPLATYELANVKVNSPETSGQKPEDITTIPPGITAYVWIRTV